LCSVADIEFSCPPSFVRFVRKFVKKPFDEAQHKVFEFTKRIHEKKMIFRSHDMGQKGKKVKLLYPVDDRTVVEFSDQGAQFGIREKRHFLVDEPGQ
jgi:hypothetical protein